MVQPPEKTRPKSRLGFVDDLRGAAVVFMILWHTCDSWLRPELKDGPGWTWLVLIGGMAAPLFLFLAGWGVGLRLGLGAERGEDLRGVAFDLASRGLGIVALGYGLRLQMWMLDRPVALFTAAGLAWFPMVAGVVMVWWASEDLRARRRRLPIGVLLYLLGVSLLPMVAPSRYPGVVRVDVLQAIGASLMITAGLSRWLKPWTRFGPSLLAGALVMGLTHAARAQMPGPLPGPIAGYIALWPTPGVRTLAMFPLFPWLSYTLIGAGLGGWLGRAQRDGQLGRFIVGLLMVGALLVLGTNETRPFVHHFLRDHPAATQPVRVLYRIGIGLSLAGALGLTTGRLAWTPLRPMGQASLLLYWVHLEFAFGQSARLLKRALGYGAWMALAAVLIALMFGLALLRLHGPKRWAARQAKRADQAKNGQDAR